MEKYWNSFNDWVLHLKSKDAVKYHVQLTVVMSQMNLRQMFEILRKNTMQIRSK